MTINIDDMMKLLIMNSVLSSNLYFFTARHLTPWTDDLNPPLASEITESDFNSEYTFMKKIEMTDVRYMIDRNDWAAGSVTLGQFVITDQFRIYICTTAGTTTEKPVHLSGIEADIGGTASWEFIEEVSQEDQTFFLSETYVPLTIASEKYFYSNDITRIKAKVDIVSDENGKLPLDSLHRVIGIYSNPFTRGDRIDTKSFTDQVKDYGYVLSYNTIAPAVRTGEQVESFVFAFLLS